MQLWIDLPHPQNDRFYALHLNKWDRPKIGNTSKHGYIPKWDQIRHHSSKKESCLSFLDAPNIAWKWFLILKYKPALIWESCYPLWVHVILWDFSLKNHYLLCEVQKWNYLELVQAAFMCMYIQNVKNHLYIHSSNMIIYVYMYIVCLHNIHIYTYIHIWYKIYHDIIYIYMYSCEFAKPDQCNKRASSRTTQCTTTPQPR